MKLPEIGIVTATIKGLNEDPYYFDAKCFWSWNIILENPSDLFVHNLPYIYLHEDSEKEAIKACKKLKANFKKAGIFDGNHVAIITKGCYPKAIARLGGDSWIDVENKFVVKTFKELDLQFDNLKVF